MQREAWDELFAKLIEVRRPRFVMMMDESRPFHARAIRLARERGVAVWVLEEGYIRPDFITCEPGGVNANSRLAFGAHPFVDPGPVKGSPRRFVDRNFRNMAVYAMFYYLALALGRPFFPHYRHHRERSLLAEVFLWSRNLFRKATERGRNMALLRRLFSELQSAYFVVALQVSDDKQILNHSRGWTIKQLIETTIGSFSRCAAPHQHLVFKGHPLDRGHFPHRGLIAERARAAGCEDRVHFIDDGSIGQMISHARGVVAINSTSGLSCLHHGIPLLCLGQAIYAHPGLATLYRRLDDMDRFWRDPQYPDPILAERFLRQIRSECLVNGSFYMRRHFAFTFDNLLRRIGMGRG